MTTDETVDESTTESTDNTSTEEKRERTTDELVRLSKFDGLTDAEVHKVIDYFVEQAIENQKSILKIEALQSVNESYNNMEQTHYENIVDYMNQVLDSVNNMQYASV